jgi:hypothetical protein
MKKWILCFSSFIIVQNCTAQLLTNNDVQITINAGVIFTVNGDIESTGTTTLVNEGTITLTGNWINNAGSGLFNNSKGTILLDGNIQHITGAFPTTFYHLQLQNGTKVMNIDMSTGGSTSPYNGILNLKNAILSLKSNTLSVFNPAIGGIQRTTGYILSEETSNSAKVWWVNVGAGIHTIPFGNSAGEDISFGFTTSPPTGFQTGSLRISTYQTLPNNTPYPTTPFAINHVNNTSGADNSANTVDRFWHIENAGASNYIFRYAASENAANGNVQMRAQPWNVLNAGWSMPPLGQTNPGAQQVMVPGVLPSIPGVLSGQTWAITMNATPLPVELLSFSARRNSESEVICEWTTLTETNNDYFEVQRSEDGILFETIGLRNGSGNSTTLLEYNLFDITAPNNILYYRLKQTDFDGQYSYSKTIVVSPVTQVNSFLLFPNPASTDIYITTSQSNTFQYCIYDLAGKKVLCNHGESMNGLAHIPVNTLETGNYMFEIITPEARQSHLLKILRQ